MNEYYLYYTRKIESFLCYKTYWYKRVLNIDKSDINKPNNGKAEKKNTYYLIDNKSFKIFSLLKLSTKCTSKTQLPLRQLISETP